MTFVKSGVSDDEGVTLTTSNSKKDVKILIDISREWDNSIPPSTPPSTTPHSTIYSHKLLENKDKYTLVSEVFSVGDELLFRGDFLGGSVGTNDYILKVDSIYVPPTEDSKLFHSQI